MAENPRRAIKAFITQLWEIDPHHPQTIRLCNRVYNGPLMAQYNQHKQHASFWYCHSLIHLKRGVAYALVERDWIEAEVDFREAHDCAKKLRSKAARRLTALALVNLAITLLNRQTPAAPEAEKLIVQARQILAQDEDPTYTLATIIWARLLIERGKIATGTGVLGDIITRGITDQALRARTTAVLEAALTRGAKLPFSLGAPDLVHQ